MAIVPNTLSHKPSEKKWEDFLIWGISNPPHIIRERRPEMFPSELRKEQLIIEAARKKEEEEYNLLVYNSTYIYAAVSQVK